MARQRFVHRPTPPFDGDDLLGDGDGLVVTFLVGGRSKLFEQTVRALAPALKLLPRARTVCYLNQSDAVSEALLPPSTEVLRSSTGLLTPIGTGYATLAEVAIEHKWWLHIEDDWKAFEAPTTLACLREGVHILEHHPDIVQVRLRFYKERVMTRHMVTGQPICWQRRERFDVAAAAHWTFNPALQRGVIGNLFVAPLQGERDAQERVQQKGGLVAQIFPGAFVHIGDDSLRMKRYGVGNHSY